MLKKSKFFLLVVISTIFTLSNVEGVLASDNFRSSSRANHSTSSEAKYERYGRKSGGSNKNRKTNRTKKGSKGGKNIYKYKKK